MADTQEAPKKASTPATIVRVVLLVAVIATLVSMWIHGGKLAAEHAKKLGKPENEAGVLLPWHWDGSQWKSWVGSDAGTADVNTAK